MLPCQDNYATTFDTYPSMLDYHKTLSKESNWHRCKVKDLHVEPLDASSVLCGNPAAFAAGISADAVADTVEKLGLALRVDGKVYPIRTTAYKTLLDRAKIGGTAPPDPGREGLCRPLRRCEGLFRASYG